MQGERVGILGGTFDPPHIGHVVAAVNVRHDLGLDRMLVVPANVPWQKVGQRPITPAELRLAMTQAAMAGSRGVEVATLELDRGGESNTADTLEELGRSDPAELVLVVGSDIAPSLDTWRRPEVVRAHCTLAVYDRPGAVGGRPPDGWPHRVVAIPHLDVSSSDLRARVAAGRPIDGLVPPSVARVIGEHGLYAATEPQPEARA